MATDSRLIDPSGEIRLGIFAEPIGEVNYREYALLGPLDRPRGPLARHFGFNQFQFLGGLSDSLIFGCAIADMKIAATAFLYFYEPTTRRFAHFSFKTPLALGCHFDQRPEDGTATFSWRGNAVTMRATAAPQQRHLRVDLAGGVRVNATFDESQPRIAPMAICTCAGAGGWVFARKTAGARVSGTVQWEGRSIDLASLAMLGHNDWSAGYMRRETFWNWGCLAGRLADGRIVGMNISCGVNETSYTENCFWVDGALETVSIAAFEYDRRDLMKPWKLRTSDGRVDLVFTPEGRHAEKINALVLASNFNQLFGRYQGRFVTAAGETLRIDGQLGYMERHYAKW
ncbi:MAG: DUF2804 domain-containing protein [Deltaproteobacteria bacterium]|nr:DUF2804 domain-containing protein [Deltaproteobacteria bacterium]